MLPATEIPPVFADAHGSTLWPWQAERFQLWSLLEMLQFSAGSVFWCGSALHVIRGDCLAATVVCVNNQPGFYPGKILDEIAREKALRLLNDVAKTFRNIRMVITAETVDELIEDLKKEHRYTFDWLMTRVEAIEKLCEKELKNQAFFYVSPERARFWPTEKLPFLFGDQVNAAFPTAAFDIQAAGTCLATAQNTAAVFHLMRVLEHGLGKLAVRFNVPFATDSWHRVIKGIEDGIFDLRNKQGLTDQDRKEITYYSEAASQFRHIKDAWRNHVSHARERYDESAADRVFAHVKELMEHLATNP